MATAEKEPSPVLSSSSSSFPLSSKQHGMESSFQHEREGGETNYWSKTPSVFPPPKLSASSSLNYCKTSTIPLTLFNLVLPDDDSNENEEDDDDDTNDDYDSGNETFSRNFFNRTFFDTNDNDDDGYNNDDVIIIDNDIGIFPKTWTTKELEMLQHLK